MHITAIITAGGHGKRFGAKKQFILLHKKPILFWTIDNFYKNPLINSIVISLPPEDMDFRFEIKKNFPEKEIIFVQGGKQRQDSVFNALKNCPKETDFVMIHDGVRIFLTDDEIKNLVTAVKIHKKVILAKKITDTVKTVIDSKIIGTVDRKHLYSALTPQVFEYSLIYSLHQKAQNSDMIFTDDAALCEYFGEDVYIVETDNFNIKITKPADLRLAEKILS